MYASSLCNMIGHEIEGKSSAAIGDVPDTLPMSFAFDIVVDPALGKTFLRYRDPLLLESTITIRNFEETVFMFGLHELKNIIFDFYTKFGDYNLVTKNCRHFASGLLKSISKSFEKHVVDKNFFQLITSSTLFEIKSLKRDSQNLFWEIFFSGCLPGARFYVATIILMVLEGRVKVRREPDIMSIFERGGSEEAVFGLTCGFIGYYIKTFGTTKPIPNYTNNFPFGKIRKICIASNVVVENGEKILISDLKVTWEGNRQCFNTTFGHIRIG
jgi:hypothetical protein